MSFPNFPNKHEKPSLVTPEVFMKYRKKIGRYPTFQPPRSVIFCYDRRLHEYILKNESTKKLEGFFGDFYLLEDTNHEIAVIANFGIGAPIIAILVEELAVFGVKAFLSIGVAGSLQESAQLGSVIVCDRAIRDEGTSHHYIRSEKYSFPSKSMLRRIEVAIKKMGLEVNFGTTWTIDAPYRETVAEAAKYRDEGVLTVDMEVAALFVVAKYRNVDAGALFTISDYLMETQWKPEFHLTEEHLQTLFLIAKKSLMTP
ncbi:MAG: nucleoside phosphorylase [Candidatus Hodarchaeota archaeon]